MCCGARNAYDLLFDRNKHTNQSIVKEELPETQMARPAREDILIDEDQKNSP